MCMIQSVFSRDGSVISIHRSCTTLDNGTSGYNLSRSWSDMCGSTLMAHTKLDQENNAQSNISSRIRGA